MAISEEAQTTAAMLDSLPTEYRKIALSKIQDVIEEINDEARWAESFKKNSEPMLELAEQALAEHKDRIS